jgi:Capsule assembly protein Wzi
MTAIVSLRGRFCISVIVTAVVLALPPQKSWAIASNNIPLDSPIYSYLDKLVSFGYITSDIKGIRPFTKAEAARLLLEAENNLEKSGDLSAPRITPEYPTTWRHYSVADYSLADEIIRELRHMLDRELELLDKKESAPLFEARPITEFRTRYVFLEGVPRSYERKVHDPGGDGVFGIGAGLRPDTPNAIVMQHGTEGTPLMENNEGVTYNKKNNVDVRLSSEAFVGKQFSALLEPMFLYSQSGEVVQGRVNKGYAKLGGGGIELEVGRDANWLGLGERGNITLTNNAVNFDLVKLSSPEPFDARFLGKLRYAVIFSRFDETVTHGFVRRPYFVATKVSVKPVPELEIGLNIARQVGGPGVNNGIGSILRGIIGGTDSDNTNNLAGLELRWRIPFLRNTEVYGEFSGEDSAGIWPIVESYVAGVFIPRLTEDGRNDFRFEYFFGNNILYTSGTFPGGYIYRGMPIGHSQGGAAQDFFFRYRYWLSARHNVALEYFHTDRGKTGRLATQSIERKDAGRIVWNFPLIGRVDSGLMYGWERVNNFDLVGGVRQTNQVVRLDLTYRY